MKEGNPGKRQRGAIFHTKGGGWGLSARRIEVMDPGRDDGVLVGEAGECSSGWNGITGIADRSKWWCVPDGAPLLAFRGRGLEASNWNRPLVTAMARRPPALPQSVLMAA